VRPKADVIPSFYTVTNAQIQILQTYFYLAKKGRFQVSSLSQNGIAACLDHLVSHNSVHTTVPRLLTAPGSMRQSPCCARVLD